MPAGYHLSRRVAAERRRGAAAQPARLPAAAQREHLARRVVARSAPGSERRHSAAGPPVAGRVGPPAAVGLLLVKAGRLAVVPPPVPAMALRRAVVPHQALARVLPEVAEGRLPGPGSGPEYRARGRPVPRGAVPPRRERQGHSAPASAPVSQPGQARPEQQLEDGLA